ncbi:hypothetical protein V1498_13320 [Peribacillus sp. SCS-26]|uniref:hypothetical protein n=1 Tax=Paraperibacillus marinus TaxID=3115295 RepID=UPI0039068367
MKSEWELVPEERLKRISQDTGITLFAAFNEHTNLEISKQYIRLLKEIRPQSSVVEFQDTDHLIMLDAPDKLSREIKKVISS